MHTEILVDLALARRLERAEGNANARFVEARAKLNPASGAAWVAVAGTYAMFDGPASPCTQTFGLGLFEMPTRAQMEQLEAFFNQRHAPVFHEVSPLAGKALLPMLCARGYHPVELTSVMYLPLAGRSWEMGEGLRARIVDANEAAVWARTLAEGWSDSTEFAPEILALGQTIASAGDGASFLVECEGTPVAAGRLAVHNGVALLAGASTIPQWRRRGAQRALLQARLRFAAQSGCDLAMICAEPGSASQRNAERQGFRIAYTRIKWTAAAVA